jgi:O-antigen/teichoic acid export membrane protein
MTSAQRTAVGRVARDAAAPTLVAAARNGFIGLAGSAIAALAGLALNVVVGRSLGVAAAGAFYVVVAVVTVAGTAARLGADTGLVWALPRRLSLGRPQDCRRVVDVAMWPVVAVSVILALVLFVLADPVAARLVGPGSADELSHLLRVSAPFLALTGPSAVMIAGLRGLGSVAAYSLVQNVVIAASRPLVVLAAVLGGLGLAGAVWAWCLPLPAAVVVAVVLLHRMLTRLSPDRRGPLPSSRRRLAPEFWRFSAARSVTAVVEIGIVWADVLIVSALTGSRQAGIYAAASRFVTTGTLVEASLRLALAPLLSSRLALGDRRGAERLYQSATQWIILLSWPLYVAVATYADVLLRVFGHGFAAGAPALRLLALAMLVSTATGNSQTMLLMSGRSAWQLANKSALLAVNVVLNVLLVPRWGIDGAAAAWSITIVLDSAVVLLQVRYLVGVSLSTPGVLRAMVVGASSFVVVGLMVRTVLPVGVPATVLGLCLGALAHLGVLIQQRRHFDVDVLRAAGRRRPVGVEQVAPEGSSS